MKPTILLIGKTGQIGFELKRLLPEIGNVVAPDHTELDLLNPDGIRGAVRETRPSIIVNAAGYTAVDVAESDHATAYAANAEAPAVLAEEAKRVGALLVHYSTDYVFDGAKGSPYNENDLTNPVNAYGRTKLAGETAIRDSGAFHLTFRTSWVYATRGKNFLLTILRLATEREELKVVSDQRGAPTCARDVAVAAAQVLAQIIRPHQADLQDSFSCVTGTYHMTASGETTWYDFAKAILEKATNVPRDIAWLAGATNGQPIIAKRVIPITSEEFGSLARRPPYSVLSNSRLAQTFRITLPDWVTQLERCLLAENAQAGLPMAPSSSRTATD